MIITNCDSSPCCMLLDVFACCCAMFETGQTSQATTPNISFVPWSPKRSPTMLDPSALLFQHCWGHARSLRMVYKELMGCILPAMHCRSQHCWQLFYPFAHLCHHTRNNSQLCFANNVGRCCVRFHAALHLKSSDCNGRRKLEEFVWEKQILQHSHAWVVFHTNYYKFRNLQTVVKYFLKHSGVQISFKFTMGNLLP